MSKADIIFRDSCNNILTNGTNTQGEKVRPIWPDTGEKAYTIKLFGQTATYDLRELVVGENKYIETAEFLKKELHIPNQDK